MANPTITITDVSTGQTISREMTAQEFSDYQSRLATTAKSWPVSKLTVRRRLRAGGMEGAFDVALTSLPAIVRADYGDAPSIQSNSSVFLQLLTTIGADPVKILAADEGSIL